MYCLVFRKRNAWCCNCNAPMHRTIWSLNMQKHYLVQWRSIWNSETCIFAFYHFTVGDYWHSYWGLTSPFHSSKCSVSDCPFQRSWVFWNQLSEWNNWFCCNCLNTSKLYNDCSGKNTFDTTQILHLIWGILHAELNIMAILIGLHIHLLDQVLFGNNKMPHFTDLVWSLNLNILYIDCRNNCIFVATRQALS